MRKGVKINVIKNNAPVNIYNITCVYTNGLDTEKKKSGRIHKYNKGIAAVFQKIGKFLLLVIPFIKLLISHDK
jgi:hypothetical protein